MITQKNQPSSEQYDKHLLTFRDISEDIDKLSEDYRAQILFGLAIAAGAFIIFILIFGLAVAHGFMRWFFILLGMAGIAFGVLQAFKMKSYVDVIHTTSTNALSGNFTLTEDKIIKKWAYNEKIGLSNRVSYCVRTICINQPVDVPAVVYQHAFPGDTIYLVHTPSVEGVLYAYLAKSTALDTSIAERTVKYDKRNDEALNAQIEQNKE